MKTANNPSIPFLTDQPKSFHSKNKLSQSEDTIQRYNEYPPITRKYKKYKAKPPIDRSPERPIFPNFKHNPNKLIHLT
jgi:hypothetical protein